MDFTPFFEDQARLLHKVDTTFIRYLYKKIDFTNQAIAILGQRGTGKTTLMLQYLKKNFEFSEEAIYISVDNPYFKNIHLLDFAKDFEKNGGKYLFIDEIHKQKEWSYQIKAIVDTTSLRLVISGSSLINIHQEMVDISRRVVVYFLHNLSFREYLVLTKKLNSASLSLGEIWHNHREKSVAITKQIKVLQFFKEYLQFGTYPFFLQNSETFHQKLISIINQIIESDMPYVCKINFSQMDKIKKLLYILSISVPFSPNISELAKSCELSRPTLLEYLFYLEKAGLINTINYEARGYTKLQKPDKIYLGNTNLSYAISKEANIGSNRESFFANQLKNYFTSQQTLMNDKIILSKNGDFLIDNHYTVEIGGKNKTKKQIQNIKNSFIIKDNIEVGSHNVIPLWLFGFLY